MISTTGSRHAGTRFQVWTAALLLPLMAAPIQAQTLFTVNGHDVDNAVVDVFFNRALANQGGQPTGEQRELLMKQLRDIYILATQPTAAEFSAEPEIAAQIELQEMSILAQAVAADILDGIEISEEEMRAEYDEQVSLAPKEEFSARHILVPSQGEAIDVIGQLDGGADFATLAQEKSTGPTGPNGGDLGWFSPATMVAPFAAAVQALSDGEYTKQPVQTQFGWHVIKREGSREATPPTFESARDNVRALVQQRKFEEQMEVMRTAAQSGAE